MPIDFAIIAGSEAHRLIKNGSFPVTKKSGRIPTPFGRSSPIFQARTASRHDYLILCRHGDRGYQIAAPFVNYRANLYALKKLGVRQIIAWSGPGALRKKYRIGRLVLPDDLIDETKKREDTFFKNTGLGFVRQHPVFCRDLTGHLKKVLRASRTGFSVGGTYVCTEGPRLETPAEIKKFLTFGGDLVGMTLAPEVFLAKELEICYTALCYVTNYAEGIGPKKKSFQPGVLFEGLLGAPDKRRLNKTLNGFSGIFNQIVESIDRAAGQKKSCHCQKYLERYRKSGMIKGDWRKYIKL
ncbi:MAG: MTAP family purine nucleoside phosphorylase [Planctomycetes bacterium]|nr:MTAP family purine nucleoside phosphorylase [Planctomycetota bacterium]